MPLPHATVTTIVLVIKTYYRVFAALTLLGGIMGYAKAKSRPSLIAGTFSAVLLVLASSYLPLRPNVAYVIGMTVSVLLAGKFLPDFLHKKAVFPGGLMTLLSVAGVVLTLLGWYGR